MVTSKTIANGILRSVFVLLLCAIAIYFVIRVQSIIIYLIISLILTLIGNPIHRFLMTRLKFNNTLATVTTLLLFLGMILGFILMVIPLITAQGQNLSLLSTVQIETNITQLTGQITRYLESHGINAQQTFRESKLASELDFNFIPNFINAILNTLSSFGMGLASVLFITFFFLKDKIKFIAGAKTVLPDEHEVKILNSLHKINQLLTRYFIGLLLQLFIIFILYLIVLLIFGIQNAFVIAFLCAILNIIPYIGPLIGSFVAAVLTMISHVGQHFQSEILPLTIYILIGFWIVQIIDNNISQPIIFSNSVKSHPLEIFLVILIAGFMSGIIGMVIAVPLYTILKVILKEFFPKNTIVKLLTKNI